MTDNNDDQETVAFNIEPGQMAGILAEAASKERTVVEFRTRSTGGGGRELHRAVEITNHVQALENKLNTTPPTNNDGN